MVQGAVDGQLDLSRDDPNNTVRQLNVLWRLREIDRQRNLELLELLYRRRLEYTGCSQLAAGSVSENMREEFRLFRKLLAELSGEKDPGKQDTQELGKYWRSQWAKRFGDPTDPEVQQRIAATAKALRGQ